jgi:hypothetical protein
VRRKSSNETTNPPLPNIIDAARTSRPHGGCLVGSGEVKRSQTVVIAGTAASAEDVATIPRSLDGSTPDAMRSPRKSESKSDSRLTHAFTNAESFQFSAG